MSWHGWCLTSGLVVRRSGTGKPSLLPSSSLQSATAWRPPGSSWWSPPPAWPGRRSPLSKWSLSWVLSSPPFTPLSCRLKDDGDGLTGPQPSVIGSVDKVFKQVNNFDQYQCLQVLYRFFINRSEFSLIFRKWSASSWAPLGTLLPIQFPIILGRRLASSLNKISNSSLQIQTNLFKLSPINFHRDKLQIS